MKSVQTLFSYCDNSTLCSICLLFNPSPVLMPSIFSEGGVASHLNCCYSCTQLDSEDHPKAAARSGATARRTGAANTQAAENYNKRKTLFGKTNGSTVPPSHGAKREVAKWKKMMERMNSTGECLLFIKHVTGWCHAELRLVRLWCVQGRSRLLFGQKTCNCYSLTLSLCTLNINAVAQLCLKLSCTSSSWRIFHYFRFIQ